MQIIIPMSGFGERFRKVGYQVPKPLIEIEGKPIIAHVIEMFPGETDFVFICNEDHLAEPKFKMREILEKFCPTGKIIGIQPHKLGPVHAVMQVGKWVNKKSPVVVNYCDFTCYWNWPQFKDFVESNQCDGAIPAYKGFHPHSLGTTNYAYIKEQDKWMQDIQEKQPWTDNRINEYASSGTYYFRTGQLMLDSFKLQIEKNLSINNEYYVSLTYKPLLDNGGKVVVYDLQHFMQWGTPEDVHEYNMWSSIFSKLTHPRKSVEKIHTRIVIPMAGLGERFAKVGYTTPKPLIPVSGKPMVVQAIESMPAAKKPVFVLRNDMSDVDDIVAELNDHYQDAEIIFLDEVSDGQATTTMFGIDQSSITDEEMITIIACDNAAMYQLEHYEKIITDNDADVIVWTARGYPNAARYPEMYGWVDCDQYSVKKVSVKIPLSDPSTDPIVIGAFTFKRSSDFRKVYDHMVAREGKINNEYYIDECINDAVQLGLKCKIFDIDHYLCWGTPNDLKSFEYWQSCFHKWNGHIYNLEDDVTLDKNAIPYLVEKYKNNTSN